MGYGQLKAAAAALVAVALAAWGGFRVLGTHDPSLSPRERLVRSRGGERPIEARLSWDLEHSPFSAEAPAAAFDRERFEAERDVESAAERQATPQTLADRGIVHLLRGRLDPAVADLERALRSVPDDARLLSDLAAARLARGQAERDLEDLARALEAAERAVELDPQLVPALFNRALALERLFLVEPARSAWGAYLKVDPRSGWADEARRHLETLAAPPATAAWEKARALLNDQRASDEEVRKAVAAFPQEARQHAEEDLLGAWAEAVRAGRHDEAARQLALARRSGAALAERGEHLPADAVAAIERVSADAASTAALAAAHFKYREAQRLRSTRPAEARPLFERARHLLERAGSPFAAWPSFYLAVEQFQRYDYPPARMTLRRLLDDEDHSRHPGLRGRAYWLLGLIHLGDGRPADALAAYRSGLAVVELMGAAEDMAAVHAILAEGYRYLGDLRASWRHLFAALALSPKVRNPTRLYGLFGEIGDNCDRVGVLRAARYFRDEAVRAQKSSGEPALLSHAILERGRALLRLGDGPMAERDFDEARRLVAEISDEDLRRRNEVDLLLAETELKPIRNPKARLEAATRALDFYGGQENRFFLSGLYLARARASLALGDAGSAEIDLRRGIEEVEWQRANVPEEDLRISFFDEAEELFDEMIRLQAGRPGGAEPAFDVAERVRARALLDHAGPIDRRQRDVVLAKAMTPLSAPEIRQALPRGVAVVEYQVLDDRLLAWVVQPEGVKLEVQHIGASEVDALVASLRSALAEHDEPRLASAAVSLHDLLLRPLLSHLKASDRLVIAPDGSLHGLPFAALRDRATGRYLIQDRILALAPSATFYLQALMRERGMSARSPERRTILAVGNPRLDRSRGQDLPDLPAAAEEAAALAGLFPGSAVLSGKAATKAAFLAAAGSHEWLHFGGHAVLNQEYPFLSHLLMAPVGTDSGFLFAHELYGTSFDHARLAVLAGCETGGGPIHGEGALSLARAFLAAGVPTVVASLWPVDDVASSRLFEVFYQRLRQGDDAAEALRQAQLALLERGDGGWAAYEVIGATEPRQRP